MKVSILDAQHIIFEGVVSEAILPGVGGELSILDNHETIFVALGKGFIRLKPLSKQIGLASFRTFREETKPIYTQQGLARMKNNELVILVE